MGTYYFSISDANLEKPLDNRQHSPPLYTAPPYTKITNKI